MKRAFNSLDVCVNRCTLHRMDFERIKTIFKSGCSYRVTCKLAVLLLANSIEISQQNTKLKQLTSAALGAAANAVKRRLGWLVLGNVVMIENRKRALI